MKKYLVVLLVLIFTVPPLTAVATESTNKELLYQQTQEFKKPIKEGAAKASGVWRDAFNSGLVDPGDYFTYYEDFITTAHGISTNADLLEDYFGVLNSGTIALQDDTPGGEIWLTTAANSTTGTVNMQLNGEAFRCINGKKIWFEAGLNIEDITESDWFVGLSVAETTILAGANDLIGFRCADSTGDIDYVVELSTTETTADTGFNVADGTAVRLGFMSECGTTDGNGYVTFYVNDSPIVVSTAYIPFDQTLTPTFEIRTSTTGAAGAEKMEIDYVKIMQER